MIIHCLSCGKSISSHGLACPYCYCEVTDITFELNGIEEKSATGLKDKMMNLVLGLVHK